MMSFLAPALTGFAASAALIAVLGAQNLFVLRQGLKSEHVAPIVLFCAGADALLISLGVAGAGVALGAAPSLTLLLGLSGAGFLAWYGLGALRRLGQPAAVSLGTGGGLTRRQALATTAAFTFLNPHVYLDTVLLLGTLGAALPAAARPAYVAGAAGASLLWFTGLGFGARLAAPLFCKPAAWRVLDLLVGLTMLTLSAMLAAHALRAA